MGIVMPKNMGCHLLIDFFGVDGKRLRNKNDLMKHLESALKKGGFRILQSVSVKFIGGGRGVTGLVLLAQSHAAFHSYPEYGYLALDIYACGGPDPAPVAKALSRYLRPKRVRWFVRRRG